MEGFGKLGAPHLEKHDKEEKNARIGATLSLRVCRGSYVCRFNTRCSGWNGWLAVSGFLAQKRPLRQTQGVVFRRTWKVIRKGSKNSFLEALELM